LVIEINESICCPKKLGQNYESIILLVVLSGCETWSLTSNEGLRFVVLMRIFSQKMEEVMER